MATAPYGVRLLVGAAVTAIEETLKLPQTILTYPMTVASQVAHLVMKVQQDVADLVNRGDETLESLFPPKDEQPEWATFDEDVRDEAPAPSVRTVNGSPRAGSRCSPAASRTAEDDDDSPASRGKRPARGRHSASTTRR